MVAWTSCNKLAFVKAALRQNAFQNLDLIAVFLLRAEAGFLFEKLLFWRYSHWIVKYRYFDWRNRFFQCIPPFHDKIFIHSKHLWSVSWMHYRKKVLFICFVASWLNINGCYRIFLLTVLYFRIPSKESLVRIFWKIKSIRIIFFR